MLRGLCVTRKPCSQKLGKGLRKMRNNQVEPIQEAVSRSRRYFFISRLTAFCLLAGMILAIAAGVGVFVSPAIVEAYVNSLLTLATASVMAYVTGSVVDYNGGVANMFTKRDPPEEESRPSLESEESKG